MHEQGLLRTIGIQLEDWARESVAGGWSTHQVESQRQLADTIWRHLGLNPETMRSRCDQARAAMAAVKGDESDEQDK